MSQLVKSGAWRLPNKLSAVITTAGLGAENGRISTAHRDRTRTGTGQCCFSMLELFSLPIALPRRARRSDDGSRFFGTRWRLMCAGAATTWLSDVPNARLAIALSHGRAEDLMILLTSRKALRCRCYARATRIKESLFSETIHKRERTKQMQIRNSRSCRNEDSSLASLTLSPNRVVWQLRYR